MNYSIYRVSLDMHDTSSQVMLNVKQGDSARKIYISLTDGGRPYKITEDCSARLRAKTTANAILFNDCTIKDNVIEYTLTNETCKNVGIVECEIALYGANGQKITSARFSLIVEGVITSDNEIESADEFTALTNALAKVGNAESKKNKVETITDDATNEQYPSAKAVADYVKNNSGGGSSSGGGVSEDILNDKIEQILNAWIEEYQPESKMDKVGELEVGSEDYYPNCIAVKNYVDDNAGGASEEVCWKVEAKTAEVCYEATLEEDDEGNMVFVLTGNIVEPAEEYGPEDGSVTVDGEQIYVGSLVVGDEGAREYEVFYVKRTETIYIRTPETVGPFKGELLEGVFTKTGEQVYSVTITEEKTVKLPVSLDVSEGLIWNQPIPDDVIDKGSICSDAECGIGEYDEAYGEPVYHVTFTKDWYVNGEIWGNEGDMIPFVYRTTKTETTVYYTPLNVTDSFRIHKEYIDSNLGDIDSALDSIIAIQNSLIGGDSE